jgi:hypothetical protein
MQDMQMMKDDNQIKFWIYRIALASALAGTIY